MYVFRDTALVVGPADHRRAVFLHQRQHHFQALALAGHRIDQLFAAIGGQTGFQRFDKLGIDAQRHIDGLLDDEDSLG